MIKYCHFLGSSSKGNSFLIQSSSSNILIDAGLTGKKIIEQLQLLNVAIESIDAIFFTHEHMDHSQGIKRLSRFPNIKLFATRKTANAIERKYDKQFQWECLIAGSQLQFRDLFILPFSIPHDAADPVGFFIQGIHGGKSLCWMTDLGHVPQNIVEFAKNADILVLESNYDEILLKNDDRPIYIKERIKSTNGHLSNSVAHKLIDTHKDQAKWEKIFLAHISRDCNDISEIIKLFDASLINKFNLTIVNPHDPSCIGHVC